MQHSTQSPEMLAQGDLVSSGFLPRLEARCGSLVRLKPMAFSSRAPGSGRFWLQIYPETDLFLSSFFST